MSGRANQASHPNEQDLTNGHSQPNGDRPDNSPATDYSKALLADIRQRLITPTRALTGYAELLTDSAKSITSAQVREDIEAIDTTARLLNELVEGLLYEPDDANSAANKGTESERQLRHDLRTPINGILGFSELLLEDTVEPATAILESDLRQLIREAQQFLDQLDSIVSFSRADSATNTVVSTDHTHARRLAGLVDGMNSVKTNSTKQRGHILVVDDIPANRQLLQRRLRQDGHTVSMAGNGHEALAKLLELSVDLVLLDLMMPGLNGFDVLQKMKAQDKLRNIPVVITTAMEDSDGAIRCIEAGAYDYLLKPINAKLLQARIQSGLESKRWSDSEREQRDFIQQAFSRFLSPAVVDELVNHPDKLSLGGERVAITCLFTDLADFTALIERSEPGEALPVLNRYLDGMCQIVLNHNGTIDKIVGDALHVFFGAPVVQENHAELATHCAIALDDYAREFVKQQDAVKLGFGHTRIGVHSGVAVVGNFGGDCFFDYTAHGDVINTTARMESVNKYLGTTLCISGDTAKRCGNIQFRPIGELLLQGKEKTVPAFTPETDSECRCPFENYMAAYHSLDSDKQSLQFEQLYQHYPYDTLVALHYHRQRDFQRGVTIRLAGK